MYVDSCLFWEGTVLLSRQRVPGRRRRRPERDVLPDAGRDLRTWLPVAVA